MAFNGAIPSHHAWRRAVSSTIDTRSDAVVHSESALKTHSDAVIDAVHPPADSITTMDNRSFLNLQNAVDSNHGMEALRRVPTEWASSNQTDRCFAA